MSILSSKLTTNAELPDSLALNLLQASRAFQASLSAQLLAVLERECGTRLTLSQLGFLASLICGENTASDIARRNGVSRQAAQKQVHDMVALGYLAVATDPDRRNQALITFTDAGTGLMSACRVHLAKVDGDLLKRFDEPTLRGLTDLLESRLDGR